METDFSSVCGSYQQRSLFGYGLAFLRPGGSVKEVIL